MQQDTPWDKLLQVAFRASRGQEADVEALVGEVERFRDDGHLTQFAHFLRACIRGNLDAMEAAALFRAFGTVFKGDEVGAVGHDLLLDTLHYEMRAPTPGLVWSAALDCLEAWLPDDDERRWETVLDGLVRKTAGLGFEWRERVERLALEWIPEEPESSEGCPSCGEADDIQRYPDGSNSSWFCPSCGKIWWDEDAEECEESDVPAAWTKLLDERGSNSRAKAWLERRHVPEFLKRVLDVHEHLSLALLESLDVGHLCAGTPDLELLEIDESESLEGRVRAVLRGGRRGFSLEAAEDRYLVFAYF